MRLDQAVAAQPGVRSRSAAADLIRGGRVRVDGEVVLRPGLRLTGDERLQVEPDPWVSRAAHKLLGALDALALEVPERVLDAGASTGGFSQVLLARGARRVHAFDVGHDQLAAELRNDPRVVNVEGFNLRELTPEHLPEPVDLVVGDLSFISLQLLLEPLFSVIAPRGRALLMVKPQFEVGRAGLDSRGVVSDPQLALASVTAVRDRAAELGWPSDPPVPSALPGENGNQEYFVLFRRADGS